MIFGMLWHCGMMQEDSIRNCTQLNRRSAVFRVSRKEAWPTIVSSGFEVQTASSKKAASKKQKPSARTATVAKQTLFTPRLELAVEMKNSLMKVQSKREFDKLMEQHKNKIAWEKKKATHINWKIAVIFFPSWSLNWVDFAGLCFFSIWAFHAQPFYDIAVSEAKSYLDKLLPEINKTLDVFGMFWELLRWLGSRIVWMML